jgi:flagellar operon protein (TIGR03826 family)
MAELANCPRCGDLFVKDRKPVCDKCFKEEEAAFEKVYKFVKDSSNRMATREDISKETGVKEDWIVNFIRTGRLRITAFPNLGYPCETCGDTIRRGRLCEKCSKQFKKNIPDTPKPKSTPTHDFDLSKLNNQKDDDDTRSKFFTIKKSDDNS